MYPTPYFVIFCHLCLPWGAADPLVLLAQFPPCLPSRPLNPPVMRLSPELLGF